MLTSISAVDDGMHRHINALGFVSLSSYKLWCRRNGFSMSLDKSSDDLQSEIDHLVAATQTSDTRDNPNHSPHREDYIRRIAGGLNQRGA